MEALRNAAQIAGFGSRPYDSLHLVTDAEAVAVSVLNPRLGSMTLDHPKVLALPKYLEQDID
jgi:hypothetical protein